MRITLIVLTVLSALSAMALLGSGSGGAVGQVLGGISLLCTFVLLGAQAVSGEVRAMRKELAAELQRLRESGTRQPDQAPPLFRNM